MPEDKADKKAEKAEKFPKITSDLVKLRQLIGGLQATNKQGVQFKVKSAADLMVKFRDGLDALKMVSYVAHLDVRSLVPVNIEGKYNKPTRTDCSVVSTVYVGSSDGSGVYMMGTGHGMDTDDKAEGKASTYAWKDAIIKGLNLPDAEMESVSADTVDADDESNIGGTPEVESPLNGLLTEVTLARTLADLDGITARAKTQLTRSTGAMEFVAARDSRKKQILAESAA